MKLLIEVPSYVKKIQEKLIQNGYECYLVGGSVRDSILGLKVNDYDLTTNCDIGEMEKLFSSFNTINNNGEKHNTITVHIDSNNVEITSYKHDEDEENSIEVDLKHRDLTINALAYGTELIDVTNGYDDLMNGLIRAPFNPSERINEDPLRILRYLRFASKYNFKIEEETAEAIHKNIELLESVSPERIRAELDEILSGCNLSKILEEYSDVIFTIIPELKKTYGFNQQNRYHKNTLYKHIVNVCCNVKSDNIPLVRIAALLHDIGKPDSFTIDEEGNGHFYGHAEKSSEIALKILKRLKYSNDEIEKALYLISNHDVTIQLTKKSIRKNFSNTPNQDKNLFYMLVELMNADKLDHTEYELLDLNKIKEVVEEIIYQNLCLKLSDLKINGYDVMSLGYSGKSVGIILNKLLELVIDDALENEKDVLISKIKDII